MTRELARIVLKAHSYEIIEASDGVEALKRWSEMSGSVDLLLTDVVMPNGIDGLALAERLLAQNPGLKVIYTTGYSSELLGEGRLERDGAQLLSKPYQSKTLLRAVQDCLGNGEARLAP